MPDDEPAPRPRTPDTQAARFPATRWSLVAGLADAPEADREGALAELCQSYWFPLYAFVRHEGHGPEDAEDLTQGFFAHLFSKGGERYLDGAKGRLRSYLLGAMKRYLVNEWRAGQAQKRGGGMKIVSLDTEDAQLRYEEAHRPGDTPDVTFQRQWVMTVLTNAREHLKQQYGKGEKRALFAAIEGAITDPDAIDYATAAAELGMKQGALRTAVHRLRRRYGEAVKEVIADTLEDPEEAEEEYRELVQNYA